MDERVLLIEDDSRLAGMVAEYLGKAGFRVIHAENGSRVSINVLNFAVLFLALLLHQPVELDRVDREARLRCHLQRQVQREALGVV